METLPQTPAIENQNPATETTQAIPPPVPPVESTPPSKGSSLSKGVVFVIIFFLLALVGAGWYFQSQLSKSASVKPNIQPQVAKVTTLVVGTDATLPPMEYTNKGKYIGYDIDLTNFIAKELGAKVEIKNIPFDDLFTALEQKKIDVIVSAVTITDDRKKKYDFSDPYLNAGQVIITKIDNTTIKTTADLRGKKIGVQTGTTNEKQALLYTSPNLVIRYNDFVEATKALSNGQIDAIFNDLPGAKGTITDNPTLKIASDPFTNEYYGIVFRKGDPNVKQVNNALDSIRIKGYLTDLQQKWLD